MSLAEGRNELGSKIFAALGNRAAETADLANAARGVADTAQAMRDYLLALGRADKGYAVPHDFLGQALLTCVHLAQDIEVVNKIETVLDRAGIDQSNVIDERTIDYGVGNVIRIAQDGPAEVLDQSDTPCTVAPAGQIALRVPVVFQSFGSTSNIGLTVSLALDKLSISNDVIAHRVSRKLHLCPEATLDDVFEDLIINEASSEVDDLNGVITLPRLPNLQFGRPHLFAPHFNQGLQQPFFLRRRGRSRFGPFPVERVPGWADTAMRIHPEILLSYIDGEIRRANPRAGRSGPPRYIDGNAVDATIIYRDNGSVVDCGVRIGWDLTVTLVVRTFVTVSGNQLTFRTITVSDRYDIRIRPRVLGWLFRDLERLAGRIIDAVANGITNTSRIRVPTARRLQAELSAEHLALFMQTRSTF